MATVKVWHNGLSAGIAPSGAGLDPGKRGQVRGWSVQSSRSNTRFLFSVRSEDLTGQGWTATLTVLECPDSEIWKRARHSWLTRMSRLGVSRLHWVVEWQERGAPHLHAAMWFDEEVQGLEWALRDVQIWGGWLDVCRDLGMVASDCSQYTLPIRDLLGWLQYLSKHAARGAGHYQRAGEGIPDGWKSTGRMWGYIGEWPTDEPSEVDLDGPGWILFRRLVRSYRVSVARRTHQGGLIRAARRMLRWPDPKTSSFRGVSGWVPEAVSLGILRAVELGGGVVSS